MGIEGFEIMYEAIEICRQRLEWPDWESLRLESCLREECRDWRGG